MNNPDTVQLYELYCRFTEELNQAVNSSGARLSDVRTASYPEFMAVWNSLPKLRQESWRLQFETGHEEVAKMERLKLLRAFTSNKSTDANVTCPRAA
jgi:hypothetical protein